MGMQNKSEVIIIFSIGWYNKYAYTQLESRFQRRLFSHPLYGTVILYDIYIASSNNSTYSSRPKAAQTREDSRSHPIPVLGSVDNCRRNSRLSDLHKNLMSLLMQIITAKN